MENANNNHMRCKTEAASAVTRDNATAAGQWLPPAVLAPCLADLKRQIALRQAMP